MKIITFASLVAIVIALSGCVTPEVRDPDAAEVDLHQFQKVQLVVTNSVQTGYATEAVPIFDDLLKGGLQSIGYTLVDADPELVVNVRVNECDPGDRFVRFLAGFVAGRAVLNYTAQIEDPAGKLLAELHGGKSYGGLESLYRSDESLRKGMISHSAIQIEYFIRRNGKE
jgi:hypothetical protein